MTTSNATNLSNSGLQQEPAGELVSSNYDDELFWKKQKRLGRIPTRVSFSTEDAKANIQLNERVKEVFEGVRESNIDKIESAFRKGSIPPAICNAAIFRGLEKNDSQIVEALLNQEGNIPEKTLYVALEFGLNNKDPSIIKISLIKLNLSREKMVFILENAIKHNYTENLEMLLNRINIEPAIYAQLLHLAFKNNNAKAIDILLEQRFSSPELSETAMDTLKGLLDEFDNYIINANKPEFVYMAIELAIKSQYFEAIPIVLKNKSLLQHQLIGFLEYAAKQSDLSILKTALEILPSMTAESIAYLAMKAMVMGNVKAAEAFLEKGLVLGDLRDEIAIIATQKGYTSILSLLHKEGPLSFNSYYQAIRIAINNRDLKQVMILLYNNPSHVRRDLFELIQHTKITIQESGLGTDMQTILILLLQAYWLA